MTDSVKMKSVNRQIRRIISSELDDFIANATKNLSKNKRLKKRNPFSFISTKYEMYGYLHSSLESYTGLVLQRIVEIVANKNPYIKKIDNEIGLNNGFDIKLKYGKMPNKNFSSKNVYLSIKSGPKWGNADQVNQLNNYTFKNIKKKDLKAVTVLAHCYGPQGIKTEHSQKFIDRIYEGQQFWTWITGGNEHFYSALVKLMQKEFNKIKPIKTIIDNVEYKSLVTNEQILNNSKNLNKIKNSENLKKIFKSDAYWV